MASVGRQIGARAFLNRELQLRTREKVRSARNREYGEYLPERSPPLDPTNQALADFFLQFSNVVTAARQYFTVHNGEAYEHKAAMDPRILRTVAALLTVYRFCPFYREDSRYATFHRNQMLQNIDPVNIHTNRTKAINFLTLLR